MATTRSAADERKLSNRLNGVMKKANDLFTMFDVNVAFYVVDGDNLWSYQSRPDWLSEMKDMVSMNSSFNDCPINSIREECKKHQMIS
jgi:SRF-type transcription factor (DNA-binding and dimerisation domain)